MPQDSNIYQIPGERIQSKTSKIKENIEDSYKFFNPSYKMFNDFRCFLYKSTLNATDRALLTAVKKPQLEFNTLQAYVSRLLGEFADQVPGIEVGAKDEEKVTPEDIRNIDTIDGHIRHIITSGSDYSRDIAIYDDMLSGGFSVAEIRTDYSSHMSFSQDLVYEKCQDPTLCGFDPMATNSTKSDGDYCFKCFPMKKEKFLKDYPGIRIEDIKYSDGYNGFQWALTGNNQEFVVVVDYYEKKKKKVKIVELANGKVLRKKQYQSYLSQWNQQDIAEVPSVIINERMTTIDTICRYRLIQNKILEYVETDFDYLPLVFFPGNTHRIKNPDSLEIEEISPPYIKNARDSLRLKNFAGQTWANEIENLVQHKVRVSKEALPDDDDDLEAYRNFQQAAVMVYKGFLDSDPNVPLAPPDMIVRAPIPQEVVMAFESSDKTIQASLGAYDASIGVNGNDISGKAIVEGATNSNAAAMPYVSGYLAGLNQVAIICLSLIFKYKSKPANISDSVPVIDSNGKKKYSKLSLYNSDLNMDSLNVEVKAGANFAVQKNKAIQQMIGMSKGMPAFADFLNAKAMPIVLDNMEMRGIEKLKELAIEWQAEIKQKQASQPHPEVIKMQIEQQKLQLSQQKMQADLVKMQQEIQLKMKEMQVKEKEVDNELTKIMLDAKEAENYDSLEREKLRSENEKFSHSHALDIHKTKHAHDKDKANLANKLYVEHSKEAAVE